MTATLRGTRAEHEDLLTAVVVYAPDTLNGEAGYVFAQDFAGDLPRALSLEAIRRIKAGTPASPRLTAAAVVDQGHFSATEVEDYLHRIDADWDPVGTPEAMLRVWATDAVCDFAEQRRTVHIAKVLERCTATLQSNNGATAADVLPDLERMITDASEITGGAHSTFAAPVPITKLQGSPDADWIVDGLMARGASTLLTGLWKAGKTTLINEWLRGFCGQHMLGFHVQPAKALVVTEESSTLWINRRQERKLTDAVHMLIRPFRGRPDARQWAAFMRHVGAAVEREQYDVLILDTWAGLAPMESENDAAQVLSALAPLIQMNERLATLLVHHPCKGDANEGRSPRGSGALMGAVDIMCELRRMRPSDEDDTHRTLTNYSRYDETPRKIIVEWTPDGYLMHQGLKLSDVVRDGRQDHIASIIGDGPPDGLSRAEINDAWTEDDPPTDRTLQRDLAHGYKHGVWGKSGTGKLVKYHVNH